MHDVLDMGDLVPDEAEQRRISGYPVGRAEADARAAAAAGDEQRLAELERVLAGLRRRTGHRLQRRHGRRRPRRPPWRRRGA